MERYRENRESIILSLFGRSPETRLLDLFMDNPLFEFTRGEVIDALGMAKVTLQRVLPVYLGAGVIVETRKIGKASLYRFNSGSSIAQCLRELIRSYTETVYKGEGVEEG